MDQSAISAAANEAGFEVFEFSDHPNFFGNWRAKVKRGTEVYELVDDNREGWLMLLRKSTSDDWSKVKEVDCHTFDEQKTIAVFQEWLQSLQSHQADKN